MNQSFEIRSVPVGPGAPCYIIAEAGSNHLGRLDVALEMVDLAAQAGANAIKFQTFEASRLYPRSAGVSDYLGDPRPIFEVIQSVQMPPEWLPKLRERANECDLAFISTPFHEEAAEQLAPYVDAYKIASYELTHEPLLAAVASKGKPIILSTGASLLDEVRAAVELLESVGCKDLALMQCTAAYPAPLESLNLRALATLNERFGVPTGLSDHSHDPRVAPIAAVALGARLLEKHFTISNHLPGPDHPFAIEPAALAEMVHCVRAAEDVLGSGRKVIQPVERELRHFARRSVMTTVEVKAGEPFGRANVDVLRHGMLAPGLAPRCLPRVLHSTAARDLPAEHPLQEADLEEGGGAP